MGDPKQDLKGQKCLRNLVENYNDSVEYIDVCHRCPQKHLNLSNLIVANKEQQHSDKTNGIITICYEKDKPCNELMQNEKFDLCYISKKQGRYETHKQKKSYDIQISISEELESQMQKNYPNANELALLRVSYYYAEKLLKNYENTNDKKRAMCETFKAVKLSEKYGIIINMLPCDANGI